jgi:predicted nucleotidyltransferase
MSDHVFFPSATKIGTIVPNMVAPSDPGAILFGSTRQAILALTFLRPDESFYLREIVRRTGCGTGAVQRELKLLTHCGILRCDQRRFFHANADSPVYEPLKQIVIRTIGLGERLRNVLHRLANHIVVAFIFGSFSRGEHHQTSDVDVLVITKDDQPTSEQIGFLLGGAQEQLGREINPFVLTARQWRLKWSTDNPFVHRVFNGEKLYLIGDDDELKRLAEKRVAQAASADPAARARSAGPGRSRSQKRKGQGIGR